MRLRLPRLLKWIIVFVSLRLTSSGAEGEELRLGPIEKPAPRELAVPVGSQTFSVYEALHGAYSSPEQCAIVPNGLWAEAGSGGECIRYYAAGIEREAAPQLLVYFSGDVINRTSAGVRFVSQAYYGRSPDSLQAEMQEWSREAGQPTIYLARPGMSGSSGSHLRRRLPIEIDLMDAALDLLKQRFHTTSFILVGHSGGGHIVASLLNRRNDIDAAIISSGMVSVRQVVDYWTRRRKVPDSMIYDVDHYYDPITEIDKIRKDPLPQIYVISDPEDRNVPFYTQLRYVRLLRAAGLKPHHIYAHAGDDNHHLLFRNARTAAALIAREASAKEIRRALDEIDLENLE
jgi:pimeloyl-ACP methyl ester carboxylesterase